MKIDYIPSPNCDSRGGLQPDMLLLHYTGMPTAQEAIDRLCDPAAEVSSHYLVQENGEIVQLVREDERAWHAGAACWQGDNRINARSIGIEIVNPGHEWGYRPFPDAQMEAVATLCHDIISRHAIAPRHVLGHSDVAFRRKQDPGELFDWEKLARAGIGLWPDKVIVPRTQPTPLVKGAEGLPVERLQSQLAAFGYDVKIDGMFGPVLELAVVAFQRHFRSARVNGEWDAPSQAVLDALLVMV